MTDRPSVVRLLIRKDLYLTRWIVAAATAAGLASAAIIPFNGVAAYVGHIALLCTLIVLNIALVFSNVLQERKDRAVLFILSLPISARDYITAKAAANLIAFVGPWLLLTAAACLAIDRSAIPNGALPFIVTLSAYTLFYFCALLSVALLTDTPGAHIIAIGIGNISFNFVIPLLFRVPGIARHHEGAIAVWAPDVLLILGLELLAAALLLGIAIVLRARRGDFV